MNVNVISTKLIKPSTPTPQNLNKYKISLTDELSPPMNVSVILFYPPNPNPKPTTLSHLQESLSKILPQFYPFAGRYIKKDRLVDCNDEGAEFVEAEAIDIELIDYIAKAKSHDQMKGLLYRQTGDTDKSTDPLLSVQITCFMCGGLTISVTMSHRISDASSLETFVAAWSNANNTNNQEPLIIPSFNSPSLFPGINLDYSDFEPPNDIIVVKRLSFNKDAISNFKSKLRPRNGKGFLSRVRVVSAVITKALIGVDIAKYGKLRDCFILQAVNMRGRTIPPLPKHSCGNLLVESIQCMDANEAGDIGIQELVDVFGDAIHKTIKDCAELLSVGEDRRIEIIMDPITNFVKRLVSGEVNAVWFSDWSKFGFYETDFGWGKPVWAGIGNLFSPNFTLLMDNKEGDGIEAWVYLNQNDLPYFEQNEDMKLFTIA